MLSEKWVGWLAPNGTFHQCSLYEHWEMSKKLVEIYFNDDENAHFEPDQWLYANGFVHISIIKSNVPYHYAICYNTFLSEAQKPFLEKFIAEERENILDYELEFIERQL